MSILALEVKGEAAATLRARDVNSALIRRYHPGKSFVQERLGTQALHLIYYGL